MRAIAPAALRPPLPWSRIRFGLSCSSSYVRPCIRREQVQHEIVNGLGKLQRLIVFGWLRFDGEGGVRITKPRGVGSQRVGCVGQLAEVGIHLARKVTSTSMSWVF